MLNDSSTSVAQGDFDQSLNPITSYDQGSSGGAYSVREGDTLAGLAERLWGDASLWWKIAEANGLTGQAALVEGQALTLPAGVMRATHNAQTFQPYDPSETIGDTAPTTLQPTPKKNKCGVFGRIFIAIIAFAVEQVLNKFIPGVGGVVGKAIRTIAIKAGAAAVSQGVAVATGIQDKFSWNAVGLAALSAGVNASPIGRLTNSGVANAMISSAVTQGLGVATGLQDKFDWAAVAAAGVGSYVGARVGNALPMSTGSMTASTIVSTAQLLANAGARSLIDGSDFGDNILAALPDVIGQTIGSAFADGISGASKPLTASKIELFAPMEEANYSPLTELADIIDMPSFDIAAPRLRAAASGDFDWGAVWADVRESESMRLLREAQDARPLASAGNALFSADEVAAIHDAANVAHWLNRQLDRIPADARRIGEGLLAADALLASLPMRLAAPAQYDEMMGVLGVFADRTIEEFSAWNDANLANGLYTQQTFDDLRTLAPYAVAAGSVLVGRVRGLARAERVVTIQGYQVGPHGGIRANGGERHHGVSDYWAQRNQIGYGRADAPTILLSKEQHNETRVVYNRWLAEQRRADPRFALENAPESAIRSLAERQLTAAHVPQPVRVEYWRQYNEYISSLSDR